MVHLFFLVLTFFVNLVSCQATAVSKSAGPPLFFLQDPSDGLCLAGSTYKRCGVDTLWYVTGKPGTYQIHHKVLEDASIFDDADEDTCLNRVQCHLEASELALGSCNHCGAKKWNIRGEAQTGSIVLCNDPLILFMLINLFVVTMFGPRICIDRRWQQKLFEEERQRSIHDTMRKRIHASYFAM
jgi:hypothetical protein